MTREPKSLEHIFSKVIKAYCCANHLRREKRKIMRRKAALESNFSVLRRTVEGVTEVVGFMVLVSFYMSIVMF